MNDTLREMAPLAIFVFGAIVFPVLSAFYWSEWRRKKAVRRGVFPVFTLVCAAAFLDNLLLQLLLLRDSTASFTVVVLVQQLTAGLLPPLMLHVVWETAGPRTSGRWRQIVLAAFYAAGIAAPLARLLSERGAPVPWSAALYEAPAAILGAAAAAGLLVTFCHTKAAAGSRGHRNWVAAVLGLMLACAAASLAGWGAAVDQLPDYLVLVFFSVTLYYRERLAFFDLLVKRGAFLAFGMGLVALAIGIQPPSQWTPWAFAIAMAALWMTGAWAYPHVCRAVDHLWLRRPYSVADAERQFYRDIQAAETEEGLRKDAAASLREIFRTAAEVRFDVQAPPPADDALAAAIEPTGSIVLPSRPDGIPFLSDDRRLLLSLAGALRVVLENVRFRADLRRREEREQQLRLLATRAELKALRAQINPHFLFNSLSVIAGLIQYQPELADDTIEQLSQVFRYTLRNSDKEWSLLGEEVEFVAAYLRVEQARFGKRLGVEFAVDPRSAQVPVPSMCIQPLIENAVKHGISSSPEGGKVGLRSNVDGERLVVEVWDTGPGFPRDFRLDGPGEGHGLRNVSDRLRGYYGDAAHLSWSGGPGGTRVTIELPRSAARAQAGAAQ